MTRSPRRIRLAPPRPAPALAVLAGALLAVALTGCGSMTVVGGQDHGGASASDAGGQGSGDVDAGAYDGGGAVDGGATDGGAYDGGVYDGGATDGGAFDGGVYDGGAHGDGGSGKPCTADADCPQGEICQSHCPPCDADAGPCPGAPCYLACTAAPNCGDLTCTAGQVCVIGEGGAQLADGGSNVTYSCQAFPAQCRTVATCDCAGRAICGAASQTDCSGSITVVTCQYP